MVKKDKSISLLRVLAMLSIIMTHWCKMAGINDFQLFSIGVEIFLFISGYLYAGRNIERVGEWLIQRWRKLVIPFWIIIVLNVVLQMACNVWSNDQLSSLAFNIMNVQGLNRFLLFLNTGSISGMAQTWFLTILMICYFLMLLVKKAEQSNSHIQSNAQWIIVISILSQIVLSYFKIQIIYFICFFIGYYLSGKKWITKKNYIFVFIMSITLSVARLLIRRYADGSVLYDYIIARWSFVFLAVFIIMTIMKTCSIFSKTTEKIVSSKLWNLLDILSYPLFLTHYMFTSGNLSVDKWIPDDLILQTVVFLIVSIAFSLLVAIITNPKGVLYIFKRTDGKET